MSSGANWRLEVNQISVIWGRREIFSEKLGDKLRLENDGRAGLDRQACKFSAYQRRFSRLDFTRRWEEIGNSVLSRFGFTGVSVRWKACRTMLNLIPCWRINCDAFLWYYEARQNSKIRQSFEQHFHSLILGIKEPLRKCSKLIKLNFTQSWTKDNWIRNLIQLIQKLNFTMNRWECLVI